LSGVLFTSEAKEPVKAAFMLPLSVKVQPRLKSFPVTVIQTWRFEWLRSFHLMPVS
jgi:hypothetical protein